MRTVTFRDNDGGLIQGTTGDALPARFTPDAFNVEIMGRGIIQIPRRGYRELYATPLQAGKAVTGLWMHKRKDGTSDLIAACGDSLYLIEANGAVTVLESGLAGPTERWHAVSFKGILFLANGHNTPKMYDTTMRNLFDEDDVLAPTSWSHRNWPSHFALINLGGNQHLAAWGMREDPSRVYFSAADNFLDWKAESDAFSLAPLEDNGEKLRAVFSYKEYIVCLKETTGVVYYGVDPTDLLVADAKKIPYGVTGSESVILREDEAWWMCQEGPINLKGVLTQTAVAAQWATRRIPDIVDLLSPNFMHQTVGIDDRSSRRVRWLAPNRKSVENDLIIDYYYDRAFRDDQGIEQGAWMWGMGIAANCALCYASAGPHVVLLGGYDGKIYHGNFTYQDKGVDIPAHYRFPVLEPGTRLRITTMDVETEPGGQFSKARLHYDNGLEASMPPDLAPDVENGTVKRIVPFGYGYDSQLEIEHLGGLTPTFVRSVRLRVNTEGDL